MEWFSCKVPEVTVADSLRIKEHLENRHNAKNVVYITYGARRLINFKMSREEELRILAEYELLPREYYLTVARIVAENNIDMEVEGFKKSKSTKKLVIVGNFNEKDPFSRYLLNLRDGREEILYLTPIYDRKVLGVLRKNCFAYIHAYEVGGTNPSLLEQMLFKRPVLAYDVPFNREVLQEGGIYFEDAEDLARKIKMLERGDIDLKLIKKTQIKRITRRYNWEKVAKEYKCLFRRLSY
jgi:glycosyltransferase involved in cell wall biosynthesis